MQYLVNGLVLGAMYGLIAVAYTMIYGIIGLVNFAFGGIFMFGAFGALIALSEPTTRVGNLLPSLGWSKPAAVVAGILVGTLVGIVVERVAYRPLRGKPALTLLVSSLAMLVILQSLGQSLFGAGQAPFPSLVDGRGVRVGGAVVTWMDIAVIVVACVTMAALAFVVERTPLGRAMRATAQDPETAQLMGINTNGVVLWVFALGSGLAALSGIMFGSTFRFASPTMGFTPGLKGLVAAVVGGIGNLPGAFFGGLLLGVLETVAAAYLPLGSAYQDAVAFAVLVVLLWVRPQGLLGIRIMERA